MPAGFASQLCGFRSSGLPNTSDSNDEQSVYLAEELFGRLGVPAGQLGPEDPGTALETAVVARLRDLRPDLTIRGSAAAKTFAQYDHLGVFARFEDDYGQTRRKFETLAARMAELPTGQDTRVVRRAFEGFRARYDEEVGRFEALRKSMPAESLLNVDIAVAVPSVDTETREELAIALSLKWSLRTDRAQDCVSQGNKLSSHRRGRMPHFGVVTMEPRPAMLKILAEGSGTIDFVYHLDLPALERTIETLSASRRQPWSPQRTFDRMLAQNRLRDFADLEKEVARLPSGTPAT